MEIPRPSFFFFKCVLTIHRGEKNKYTSGRDDFALGVNLKLVIWITLSILLCVDVLD